MEPRRRAGNVLYDGTTNDERRRTTTTATATLLSFLSFSKPSTNRN